MKRTNFGKMKFFLTLMCLMMALPLSSAAFDFSDVSRSFKKDLRSQNAYAPSNRMAIIYNNASRDQIKRKINLVQFKKDFAHEILKNFEVIDPLVVKEILDTNQISYKQLKNDPFLLKSFADRADSSQVILIDLRDEFSGIQANMRLVSPSGDLLSQVVMDIPADSSAGETYNPVEPTTPETSLLADIKDNYEASPFVDGHNDAWIFFSPTALVSPQTNFLDISTWLKDVSKAEVELVQMRYDLRVMDQFQLGLQGNSIPPLKDTDDQVPNTERESGMHSVYATAKFQLLDEDELPIILALGIKTRIYWDEDNTDFVSDDIEVDEENEELSQNTFTLMVTGKMTSVGILYNFYLDNMIAGFGVKWLITSNIKLFVDGIYYTYENAHVKGDSAIGIQAYGGGGIITSLSYQSETEQTQVGLGFNW